MIDPETIAMAAAVADHSPIRLPDEAFDSAFRREQARGAERIVLEVILPLGLIERMEEFAAVAAEEDPDMTVDKVAEAALEAYLVARGA